jgi:hypothetical protein
MKRIACWIAPACDLVRAEQERRDRVAGRVGARALLAAAAAGIDARHVPDGEAAAVEVLPTMFARHIS